MSDALLVALGLLVWGAVFAALLASQAVQTDVEHRWNEAWVLDWERRTGLSVDVLIERLRRQMGGWRLAGRLGTAYLLLAAASVAGVAYGQYRWSLLGVGEFKQAMLILLSVAGLLLLPLKVVCEIGFGVVEGMQRQVRQAVGERLIVEAKRELDAPPRPSKKKRQAKPEESPPEASPPPRQ